jgi:hypothetical protein
MATPDATTPSITTNPPAITTPTQVMTTPMATKKNIVQEKKPVLNKVALAGIIIFYVIIIVISTYSGYIYGKENSVKALGLSAGFCLSSILCIFLWIHAGRKTAGVCF